MCWGVYFHVRLWIGPLKLFGSETEMSRRDDFPKPIRDALALRVGNHCSNPACPNRTAGPAADPARAINIGVAAHITAASPGGARYDAQMTSEERKGIDNAIWLCGNCAALIDRDVLKFTVKLLKQWRRQAEEKASRALSAGSMYRSIAPTELRQELEIWEIVAVKELEEEFGCRVESNVLVPAGEGYIRFDGAVVRGEDLVAIDIRRNRFAIFQVEHVLTLLGSVKFDRFANCLYYVVVVLDEPRSTDIELLGQLHGLATQSTVEMHIREYRLNTMRAKHGI
jgi:hypothetical protein